MNNIEYNLNGVEIINYYDSLGDRLIKISNKSNENKKVKLFYYYPSVFFPYYKFEKELNVNEWITPDLFYLNSCGFIIVYVDDVLMGKINLLKNKKLKKVSEKIICVGLNKTGTSSLTRSLKNNGLITWADGEPSHRLNFSNYNFTNNSIGTVIDLIEKTNVDFYQDIPFSCPGVSERIINIFPQSKYILTKRESVDKWVSSVKRFWEPYFKDNHFTPNAISFAQHYIFDRGDVPELSYLLNMFETWDLDSYEGTLDDKLRQVYINHNQSVKNTLVTNNCDWIEIDVSKKGEFKKLTNWLKINNTDDDFVWVNKTEK
jgi:hypothetical protein